MGGLQGHVLCGFLVFMQEITFLSCAKNYGVGAPAPNPLPTPLEHTYFLSKFSMEGSVY